MSKKYLSTSFLGFIMFILSTNLLSQNCEIWDVIWEPIECENGVTYVNISFDNANPGSQGFTISERDFEYGDDYEYGDSLYTFGPVEVDCNTLLTFYITDNENPDCEDHYTYPNIICCDTINCLIADILIDSTHCINDSLVAFQLDLTTYNVGTYFDVLLEDLTLFNTYPYDSLPVYIDSFPSLGGSEILVTVTDSDSMYCGTERQFDNPCFDTLCHIFNVFAEVHECNDDNEFFVDVVFESENVGSEGFEIRGNGVSYGDDFQYGETYYTVGPLIGDCSTLYEFVIIDNENPDCNNHYGFDAPICCGDSLECAIWDILVDITECNDDGSYGLYVNFQYQGTTNDFFDVWAGNEFVGYYSYENLPIHIDTFYGRDAEYDLIRICDNDNDACCAVYEFLGPDCGDEEECRIFEVFAEAHECNDNGGFFVDVIFDYDNVGNEGFSIRGNGEIYGDDFEYGETYYTIGPLLGDCETIYEFVVIDNQFDDCGGEFVFEEEICCGEEEACRIFEVYAEASECYDDGGFFVDIEFDFHNVGDEGFTIRGNGEVYGDDFEYGETYYTIGPLLGDCETIYEFVVIDNQFDDCGGEFVFEEEICCGDMMACDIRDIEIDSMSCNDDDGSYSLVLNFIVDGNTNEFFDVWAGEEYIGFYRYDELPVYISNFYPRDAEYDLIRICDNDNEDCCAIHEFMGPDCGDEEACRIFEVFAEAHECNDDGGFFVDIEFDYHNVGDEGFTIRGNGDVYGDDFEYGESYYTIGPLLGDCETIYEFVVIDNQFDDCGGEFVFEEEICCGDMMACEIRDIEIDSMSCNDDGSYSLVLNFIVEGNTNEFFDVWAGEEYVGFYRYDDLPVYISNFYPRDTEYDLIRICDNDNEDCCAIHEFRGPDCGEEEECRIFEVFAEAHECNDDGGFFVDIEFDYHNVGDEGFSIRGNGEVYGDDFEYGETFYTIGPLIGDCETIYEFVIIDNQFDDCGGEFVFEEEICCGDMMACEIRDIEIDSMSCNDDGSYSLVLNFIVEGNTNEFFDVWAGEEYVGFYRYDELPVYISNFYPRDAEYDLIRICDNDNDYCCTIHEFLGPNCEEDNECAIENLTVINTECVESEFYLLVDLDYNEAFDESEVVLFGNGTNYGAYELSEFPIALGIFDYLNDSLNEMVAYHEASNCEIFTEFEVECDDFVDSVNESKLSYLNVFSDGQILNVISKNSNNYKVQIYDISGKMVSHSTSNVSLKMNTNYLSSGIYVVKIVDMQSGHYSAQLLSLGY